MIDTKKLYKKVCDKQNVIGYSMKMVSRIRKGEEILDDLVFRVYVTKKVPLAILAKKDIIPKKLKGIETDIVVSDRIVAFDTDRTTKLRPVPLSASVGHYSITAVSLGMMYSKAGPVNRAGTNAHGVTPDVRLDPSEMTDKRICQPGPAHDEAKHVAGTYVWHDRIRPITEIGCPVSKSIVSVLNVVSRLLGRTSRFQVSSPLVVNHQDFGVYAPTVGHELEVPGASLEGKKFIGHLFAGSDVIGVICKAKYAIQKGYAPAIEHIEVLDGDKVWGASFWGDYETVVQDTSAALRVAYRGFEAMFEDVVLVKNESVIKGGWSGSGFYKV